MNKIYNEAHGANREPVMNDYLLQDNIESILTPKKKKRPIYELNTGACIKGDFARFARAYHQAATCVMNHLLNTASLEKDIAKLDIWYFAMMYMHRHSIELQIKADLLGLKEVKLIDFSDNHDVHDLLRKYEELAHAPAMSTRDQIWINAYLDNISAIDGASDLFRYPVGNDKSIRIPGQRSVSLERTAVDMEKVFKILSMNAENSNEAIHPSFKKNPS